jgi:hypothetical protein
MIEQTLSGVRVEANDRIVYVNPRPASILGHARTRLLGITPMALPDGTARDEARRIRA